jgi:hypothetical protein
MEQIGKFLESVSKSSLFEYYKLPMDTSHEELEAAVQRRRSWAQGQQANPKFRSEAIWLIKNNALVRRALLDHRDDYTERVRADLAAASMAALTPFIQGILAAGPLSPEGQQAIVSKGEELGLERAQVLAHLESLGGAVALGAAPQAVPPSSVPPSSAAPGAEPEEEIDYYELLQVSPAASFEDLEAAHRARYRWARGLADLDRASQIYARLDDAWRALETPEKRAAYDASRARRIDPDRAAQPSPAPEAPVAAPSAPPMRAPVMIAPTGPRHLEEPHEDPAGPPPPPENLSGRTLGLGARSGSSKRRPQLSIASPEVVQVKAGRQPITHRVVIKNLGAGRMAGRVSSDRKWLELSRSRLDPDIQEQEIEVTIHPTRMPRGRAIALVSVITDHGERRAITFRVERRSLLVPVLGVVALLLAILLLTQLTSRQGGAVPDPAIPPSTQN